MQRIDLVPEMEALDPRLCDPLENGCGIAIVVIPALAIRKRIVYFLIGRQYKLSELFQTHKGCNIIIQ